MDEAASPQPQTAGQQMLLFLSEAAIKTRGDYRPDLVAAIAGVDPRTIRRFESGEHWPQRLDHILSAYAFLADLEDPREIWRLALDEWYRYGTNPADLDDQERRIAERIKEQAPLAEPPEGPLLSGETEAPTSPKAGGRKAGRRSERKRRT